jgi:uncharacterized Zn-binding protein involved in type VI secretion
MGDPVFANSNEIHSKSMGGKTICNMPDVCFTPPQTPATPPGVPVPYPNTGMASDTSEGSRTVKINGKEVMLKNRSDFKKSTGDEAGAAPKKGIVSSTTKGKCYFVAWSMDVKIEGENVVRHRDMTTHNHGTAPTAAKPQPCTAKISTASATLQEKCAHKNDKGQRFVVYIAAVYDEHGNPTGKWYVGRTRGPAGASTRQILNKRFSSHHWRKPSRKRKETIGPLTAVCETDSYSAVRGAEEKHQKAMEAGGLGTKQANPISPRKGTKKKKDKYMECAKGINGPNGSTCGG